MKRGDGVNLKGNKWQYRFEGAKINGKRRQITKGGFNTREEAYAAKLKAMAEYEATGEVVKPSEISVADFIDKWFNDECVNKKKKTTVETYKKIIRLHIKPNLGHYNPVFEIGELYMTHGIKRAMDNSRTFIFELLEILQRYCQADWSDMEYEEDKEANDEALATNEDRIFATYNTSEGKIYIITEWDRSYTTIMFPSEY